MYTLYSYAYQYLVVDTEEMPYHTKFLLIASFLASYNLAKTDKRCFSEVCTEHWFVCMDCNVPILHVAKRKEKKTKFKV